MGEIELDQLSLNKHTTKLNRFKPESAALFVTLWKVLVIFAIFIFTVLVTPQLAIAQLQYESIEAPPTAETAALYHTLSLAEKNQFHLNKNMMLNILNKVLRTTKWTYGVGYATIDTIRFVAKKVSKKQDESESSKQTLSYKERSVETVNRVLSAMDHQLWEESPLVADSNEFGFVGTVTAQVMGALNNKGYGNLLDLGIFVGFNKHTKSLVFEIFRNSETYKSSIMRTLITAGLSFKGGIMVSHYNGKIMHSKGESYYPPATPGFTSVSDSHMAAGLSSGLPALFFPPSPIGDLLTYSTNLDHMVLLRIQVSTTLSNLLKVQFNFGLQGLLHGLMENIKRSVTNSMIRPLRLGSSLDIDILCRSSLL